MMDQGPSLDHHKDGLDCLSFDNAEGGNRVQGLSGSPSAQAGHSSTQRIKVHKRRHMKQVFLRGDNVVLVAEYHEKVR